MIFKSIFKSIKYHRKNLVFHMKSRQKKTNHMNSYANPKPYLKIELMKDTNSKYDHLLKKKSSSSYQGLQLNQQRLKRLEIAYRNISQKKYKSKSNERNEKSQKEKQKEKDKKHNDYLLKIPFKPFQSINLQNRSSLTPNETKRLLIRSKSRQEERQEYGLQKYCQKLSQLLLIKNQKVFVDQLQFCQRDFEMNQNLQNNSLPSLLKMFSDCQERKFQYIINKLKAVNKKLQEQNQIMASIQKKNKGKIVTLTCDNKELKQQNFRLQEQIICLNQKLEIIKQKEDKCIQVCIEKTEIQSTKNSYAQTQQFKGTQSNEMLIKVIKRVRQYEKRQKQLLSVLYILKKEGVDIEKAYEFVCKKYKNQEKQNSCQNQDEEESEEQTSLYKHSIEKPRKNRVKKHAKQSKTSVDFNTSYDADNSIISSFDAISFNYQSKEPEMEKFSPRRVYICEKQLQPSMKQKLKLNFQCMYESQSQSQYTTRSLPTV